MTPYIPRCFVFIRSKSSWPLFCRRYFTGLVVYQSYRTPGKTYRFLNTSFRNFNGTSRLRNTTRSSARETTGLKPREKVDKVASSTKEMQPSSVNIKQATETQDDLSATDGSGLTRTILPTSINKNPCIKKIRYSFIYNQLFEIPICKKNHGCHEVVKIVNFGKGRTLAVTYNCQKQRS